MTRIFIYYFLKYHGNFVLITLKNTVRNVV